MRVRATKDLVQLSDPEFFAAIAEGLKLVVKNVSRLWDAAVDLGEKKNAHAARVLAVIAEEEAAKFLILIDAVRCQRQPAGRLSRQLGRFNEHLSKGLYARGCGMCPTTLAQLQEYVDHHREQFYLDGPNDVDWIFRNEVIEGRESTLYVDYVAHDDEHRWSDPTDLEDLEFGKPLEPGSVVTARRLNDIGISSPETLATIADVWRIRPPVPDTQWSEIRRANHGTLELMESRSRLKEQPSSTYSWLMEQWQFPMYDLDLSEIPVSLAGLRERQKTGVRSVTSQLPLHRHPWTTA